MIRNVIIWIIRFW